MILHGVTVQFNLAPPAPLLRELADEDDGSEAYEEKLHRALIELVEADPVGAVEMFGDGTVEVEVW